MGRGKATIDFSGDRLKKASEKRKIKLSWLCKEESENYIGIQYQSLKNCKRENKISPIVLDKIARVLDVSPSYLLGEECVNLLTEKERMISDGMPPESVIEWFRIQGWDEENTDSDRVFMGTYDADENKAKWHFQEWIFTLPEFAHITNDNARNLFSWMIYKSVRDFASNELQIVIDSRTGQETEKQ